MTEGPLFWFFLTLFWTVIMSFYSSQEMAAISFNRARLDYAVASNKRWALLLKTLLNNPTRLFTTTLIGVNVAMMISSECSRRLFEACGLNPNLAVFFEIPFVLLFGELVPMFAARIYAEHACRLGVPLLYLSATILTPITAIVEFFFSHMPTFGSKDAEKSPSLNREELQKLLEEHREHVRAPQALGTLFSLTSKKAYELMRPLPKAALFPLHTTVGEVRKRLEQDFFHCIILFLKTDKKIIGVLPLSELLQASDNRRVREYSHTPVFVSEHTSIIDVLRFQKKDVPCIFVLNTAGDAQGIITFRDLMETLVEEEEVSPSTPTISFEKTVSAGISIVEVNKSFSLTIDAHGCATLGELIEKTLGRTPVVGDVIMLDSVEILVKKSSLFGAKTLLLRSLH